MELVEFHGAILEFFATHPYDWFRMQVSMKVLGLKPMQILRDVVMHQFGWKHPYVPKVIFVIFVESLKHEYKRIEQSKNALAERAKNQLSLLL